MQVFRHIPTAQQSPCALTIGNFDGMHLGHQALLSQLTETAKKLNISSAVMTFEPHPREFFAPESAPPRLSSMREKLEFFAEAGIEKTYVCRFNRALAKLSPQEFMQTILRNSLNANAILVGEDFRFGAMRAGSILDFIEAKFNLISLPQIDLNGIRVSSTRVRNALATGDLQLAKLLLNRPYSISGKVVHGAKIGRQLGFPTANVHMRHERPA